MKRPIIGVIPLYDDDKQSYWMIPGYMLALEKSGALPITLPMTGDRKVLEQIAALCDGLLFTGGHDVEPSVYGASAKATCGAPCRERDFIEGVLLSEFISADKPVFGICRGVQFMNAYLGGTLYQDLPSEYESAIDHHMSPPYDRAVHNVRIDENSPLFGIAGSSLIGVNSYHHQAIRELSPRLATAAVSEDGLIEAAYMPNKRFILGVQWHPELNYFTDAVSLKIFEAFVNKCK